MGKLTENNINYSIKEYGSTVEEAIKKALERASDETGVSIGCFTYSIIQEPEQDFLMRKPAIVEVKISEEARKEFLAQMEKEKEEQRKRDAEYRKIHEEEIKKVKAINDLYEYKIVTIPDDSSGKLDTSRVAKVLSEHSKEGWRLVNSFVDEIGKISNSTGYAGISESTNATICETHLIFERCIKRWNMPENL